MTHDAGRQRRLEAEGSQAARTPVARHEDDLSPAKGARERQEQSRSQRIGDITATDPAISPPVSKTS
jgi:hypothetical protein